MKHKPNPKLADALILGLTPLAFALYARLVMALVAYAGM